MHSSLSSCCHFRHTDTYGILTYTLITCPAAGTSTHLSFQLLVSQARAPVTPGVLSSRWHLLIHPYRMDRQTLINKVTNGVQLQGWKNRACIFNYLSAALQLARIVLCPFSNYLDPPFTHLGPSPKHFIISLAQSQEHLSLHPIMTSMSLSGT